MKTTVEVKLYKGLHMFGALNVFYTYFYVFLFPSVKRYSNLRDVVDSSQSLDYSSRASTLCSRTKTRRKVILPLFLSNHLGANEMAVSIFSGFMAITFVLSSILHGSAPRVETYRVERYFSAACRRVRS